MNLQPAATNQPLVLITGASSGLGQAMALAYYQQGACLALVSRRLEAMQLWVHEHQLDVERIAMYSADVACIDSMVAAGRQCLTQQGLPDIVIANAGISLGVDTAEREDLEVMQQVLATNCMGVAASFHPFIKPMRQRGSGVLVSIASVAALRGLPGHGAYCASKAAVLAYCESLRIELHGSGVQTITLLPGYVATPLTRHNQYPMPFLLTAEKFAKIAINTISKRRSFAIIPWQMACVGSIMKLIPNWLFDRMVAGRQRKHRYKPSLENEKQSN